MPLSILAILVVGGVAGLALLVHLMGWTAAQTFRDEAEARAAFAADFPDDAILNLRLADDRAAALLTLEKGVGFAAPFGAGRLTRRFAPRAATVRESGARLVLETADYGAPRLSVLIRDDGERARWAEALQ